LNKGYHSQNPSPQPAAAPHGPWWAPQTIRGSCCQSSFPIFSFF